MKELEQGKERLAAEAATAFATWQDEISEQYGLFREATSKLAMFDCLQSLAMVARSPGYVKPEYRDDASLRITGSRHPMVGLVWACPANDSS
jgi:DNA mismatch repair protein MSH3